MRTAYKNEKEREFRRYWFPEDKRCKNCGKEFEGTKDDLYCSLDCMFKKVSGEVWGQNETKRKV